MSTYGQLYLYDVPAEQARPLLDTILDEGLVEDGPFSTSRTHLVLGGEGYRCREVHIGWIHDGLIAGALLASAPGATWMAWEDPAEGGHGTVRVHVPDLGMFRADCDELGTPTFPADTVHAAATDPATAHELTGTAWFTRVLELRDQLGPDGAVNVYAPPACPGDRSPGDPAVDDPAKIQVRKRGTDWLVRVPPGHPGQHNNGESASAGDDSRWTGFDEATAFVRSVLERS